ncbi:MAG: hypothetical protein D3923_06650, partial [Candidatus Electrothrix sp. AR3]|nr:hypothetical protein [Candidatus Electrothrix sp. AR3]
EYWANTLHSTVAIEVQASMDPLDCDAGSALLGAAGPWSVIHDFVNAPQASTWYPVALANSLSGSDENDLAPEIDAMFNSALDNNNNCLSNHNWCYQIGGTCPVNSTSLYNTVLHELGHGLGFITFVDSSGKRYKDINDQFMQFLQDNNTGKQWPDMTNGERAASSRNNALVWTGANVTDNSSFLTAGKLSGKVKLYSPNPYASGSSVSHWDTSLTPNELMEPYSTATFLDTLTKMAFRDMGWPSAQPPTISNPSPAADAVLVVSSDATAQRLKVKVSGAESCTIHYGVFPSISSSVSGTLSGGYCSSIVSYGAHLTNDGSNVWYVEASNSAGMTTTYPESGTLSFTVSNKVLLLQPRPWINSLLL